MLKTFPTYQRARNHRDSCPCSASNSLARPVADVPAPAAAEIRADSITHARPGDSCEFSPEGRVRDAGGLSSLPHTAARRNPQARWSSLCSFGRSGGIAFGRYAPCSRPLRLLQNASKSGVRSALPRWRLSALIFGRATLPAGDLVADTRLVVRQSSP